MDDGSIIRLYWDRDQRAIAATGEKYGPYCMSIAGNILKSPQDREECLNDTYMAAWSSMPRDWPKLLPAYLGKITRNLAFNRYKSARAEKRGGGEIALVLEELSECVSGRETVEGEYDRRELIEAVNAFVRGLPEDKRRPFLRRYWYSDPVKDIARDNDMRPGAVSKALERARKQLREYLMERGFEL